MGPALLLLGKGLKKNSMESSMEFQVIRLLRWFSANSYPTPFPDRCLDSTFGDSLGLRLDEIE